MTLVRYSYPTFRGLSSTAVAFRRSPWAGLETEIDRLFSATLDSFGSGTGASRFPVDLYQDKDNVYVRAELPGVNRDDINVEVVDGYLTIAATRKTPATEGRGEESFSLSRSVKLNEDIHTDKIAAAYENGVLTVTVPKREEAKPRKVTVEVK
jgi:HSP20 family protein